MGTKTDWAMTQVQKLRAAMDEYDNDKWRIISGKVGNGFSASACKEKAAELDGGDDIESVIRGESLHDEDTTFRDHQQQHHQHQQREAYARLSESDFPIPSRVAEGS